MSKKRSSDGYFNTDHTAYAVSWALSAIEDFLSSDHGMWDDNARPSPREFVAHAVRACGDMFEAAYGEPVSAVLTRTGPTA